MLPARSDRILKFIVTQYIAGATPVPSQMISHGCELGVSPATIRNEMAFLEEGGYIIRPHTSAGAVPSDKGYRHYVDSLQDIKLPIAEQRLVSHLFHQVEQRVEEWMSLAAALVARSAQNVALITLPKAADAEFKHVELISLRDSLVLMVLVLRGVNIKKQLIDFQQAVTQSELTMISNKLNASYAGLTSAQIKEKIVELAAIEERVLGHVVRILQTEDALEHEEPFLDGWHFMLSQPEFAQNQRMLALVELIEHKKLFDVITPPEPDSAGIKVIIGKENRSEVIREYSVVITRYGLPNEAVGTICILGPTRMPYARAISTVDYLSSVLSELVLNLFDKKSGRNQRAN